MKDQTNYHTLCKEVTDLLKDPKAMKAVALERLLKKMGYVKKDKLLEVFEIIAGKNPLLQRIVYKQ